MLDVKKAVSDICYSQKMSFSEVCNENGLSYKSLVQTLAGNPTQKTIETVAKALKVKVSDIFLKAEEY